MYILTTRTGWRRLAAACVKLRVLCTMVQATYISRDGFEFGLELETGDGIELGHELERTRSIDFGHGLELGDGLEPGHDPSEATTFCGSV